MMTFRQFNLPVALMLLVLTFFALSPGPAQAQTGRLTGNIPFAFYVGDKLMPAGDYELEKVLNGVLKISSLDRTDAVMFSTIPVTLGPGRWTNAKLVFNTYGDDHFLSEMWWVGPDQGRKIVPSTMEHELARNYTPARASVTLR